MAFICFKQDIVIYECLKLNLPHDIVKYVLTYVFHISPKIYGYYLSKNINGYFDVEYHKYCKPKLYKNVLYKITKNIGQTQSYAPYTKIKGCYL